MAGAILLIGVPGSGKSTLAADMLRSHRYKNAASVQLISPDAIRADLYGSANVQGNWGEIWSQVQQAFARAAASQQSVIYDATNYRRQYRQEAIALARSYGFQPITGLWLNVPLWICLARNQGRDRRVPEEVVVEMYRCLTLEPPSLQEGFDHLMFRTDKPDNEWID